MFIMIRYKAGDTVTVRKDVKDGDVSCYAYIWVCSMDRFKGQTVTISSIIRENSYRIKEDCDGHGWGADFFVQYPQIIVDYIEGFKHEHFKWALLISQLSVNDLVCNTFLSGSKFVIRCSSLYDFFRTIDNELAGNYMALYYQLQGVLMQMEARLP